MGMRKKKKKVTLIQTLSSSSIPNPILDTSSSCGRNTSSSRTSIGCISGIFQFIWHHHHHSSHSRKRLSSPNSAGRKSKTFNSSPPPQLSPRQPPQPPLPLEALFTFSAKKNDTRTNSKETQQKQHEIQRSPTLPSELRLMPTKTKSPLDLTVDSPRRPTPLVAKLMGLHEIPEQTSPASVLCIGRESAAEKRRKILGALDKCDEDLKALKKIIDAVRVVAVSKKTVTTILGDNSPVKSSNSTSTSTSADEQPSPVSVLDFESSPTFRSATTKNEAHEGLTAAIQLRESEPARVNCTSGQFSILQIVDMYIDQEFYTVVQGTETRTRSTLRSQILLSSTKSRYKDLPTVQKDGKLLDSWARRAREGGPQQCRWKWRRREALVESIGEVWKDGVWEERREFERVGVVVERGILGDLIHEFVRELAGCCFNKLMSQGNRRKRLCF